MTESSVLIDAFSMRQADCKTVSDQILRFFNSRAFDDIEDNDQPLTTDIEGTWVLSIDFSAGQEEHRFAIEKSGEKFSGVHLGHAFSAPMEIEVNSEQLGFISKVPFQGIYLYYHFTGKVASSCLEGEVILGAGSATNSGPVGASQFGIARWRAERIG